MTKKKAATKKSTSVTLIVFGTLDGKQRAGTFAEPDAELAKKAAAELGLAIREVNDKATRGLAAKLRPGNAHANASGFLPVASKAIYGKLAGGMGVYFSWYYAGMAVLPGPAGMARDLTASPAAPALFSSGMMALAIAGLGDFGWPTVSCLSPYRVMTRR